MFGCKWNPRNDTITETVPPETAVPKITMFSGTEYEAYEYSYSPISSAFYKCNGIVEKISVEDPRLIRLLNFIMYSHETNQNILMQRYIYDDEITTYRSVNAPMIEVSFLCTNETAGLGKGYVTKILICGDKYLEFQDSNSASGGVQGDCAELYWPYGSIAMGNLEDNIELSDTWGEKGWIDIIEYAGF